MITQSLINNLEKKGLVIYHKAPNSFTILKPIEAKGNGIDWDIKAPFTFLSNTVDENGNYYPKSPPVKTDSPILKLKFIDEKFDVSLWKWTDKTIPGYFQKKIETEKEALNIIVNYFFEENEYFNAYREWKLKSKN